MSVGYNLLSFEYYDDNKGQQQKSVDEKKQGRMAARCNNLIINQSDYDPITYQNK